MGDSAFFPVDFLGVRRGTGSTLASRAGVCTLPFLDFAELVLARDCSRVSGSGEKSLILVDLRRLEVLENVDFAGDAELLREAADPVDFRTEGAR